MLKEQCTRIERAYADVVRDAYRFMHGQRVFHQFNRVGGRSKCALLAGYIVVETTVFLRAKTEESTLELSDGPHQMSVTEWRGEPHVSFTMSLAAPPGCTTAFLTEVQRVVDRIQKTVQ